MLQPRPYQLESVEQCRAAFRSGARAVLLVVPTGGGKTVIGSLVVAGAVGMGKRVLWLAPRRELVDQAAARMPVPSGVVMAGRKMKLSLSCQVASIDTIASRQFHPEADLLVYDEAHHIKAKTSLDIIAQYPNAHLLGLTATPERADGSALGDVFERMVVGPTVKQLTADGHLVPCDVIAPKNPSDKLASNPSDAWIKYSDGRPGFAFLSSIKESQRFTSELKSAGYRAGHVDGSTAKGDRDRTIEYFRSGRLDVLSSVYVFTEGVDMPRAQVCMLARGCGHASLYLQMAGRVLRPSPGKERALIVDLLGVAHEHGLVDDEHQWSLDGVAHTVIDKSIGLTQCPQCAAVWRPPARTCPRCGWAMPEGGDALPVDERDLVDLKPILEASIDRMRAAIKRPGADETQKAITLAKLRAEAKDRGYKQHWVSFRYKALFGHWPRAEGDGDG